MRPYTTPLLNALHTTLVFMLGRAPTHREMLITAGKMVPRIRRRVWE